MDPFVLSLLDNGLLSIMDLTLCYHVCKAWKIFVEDRGFDVLVAKLCCSLALSADPVEMCRRISRKIVDEEFPQLCPLDQVRRFLQRNKEVARHGRFSFHPELVEVWMHLCWQEPPGSVLHKGATIMKKSWRAISQSRARQGGFYRGIASMNVCTQQNPYNWMDMVEDVAIGNNWSFLAVLRSDRGPVTLWDLETGSAKVLQYLGSKPHPLEKLDAVMHIAFSGACLATVSEQYSSKITLWDIDTADPSTGTVRLEIESHSDNPTCVSFSPDGGMIAVVFSETHNIFVTKKSHIRFWDTTTGSERGEALSVPSSISFLSFSPDGSTVASGMHSFVVSDTSYTNVDAPSVCLWDVATLSKTHACEMDQDYASCAAWSPNGEYLAVGVLNGMLKHPVRVFRVLPEGLQLAWSIGNRDLDKKPTVIAYSPHGGEIATSFEDGSVEVWRVAAVGGEGVSDISTVPVASAAAGGTGQPVPAGEGGASQAAGGGAVLASSLTAPKLVWCESCNRHQFLAGAPLGVIYMAYSPDGSRLVVANESGDLVVYDATPRGGGEEGGWGQVPGHQAQVVCLESSPDGSLIASAGYDGLVIIWDGKSGKARGGTGQAFSDEVLCLAFSPDGTILASGNDGGGIKLWDTETGTETTELFGHGGSVLEVSFAPLAAGWGKAVLASAGGEGCNCILLWDCTEAKLTHRLAAHTGAVHDVQFSADGQRMASCSHDGLVKVWDMSSCPPAVMRTLQGHSAKVYCVAWSPDSTMLASGGYDGVLCMWTPEETDTEVWSWRALAEDHSFPVIGISFSPEGERVALSNRDLYEVAVSPKTNVGVHLFSSRTGTVILPPQPPASLLLPNLELPYVDTWGGGGAFSYAWNSWLMSWLRAGTEGCCEEEDFVVTACNDMVGLYRVGGAGGLVACAKVGNDVTGVCSILVWGTRICLGCYDGQVLFLEAPFLTTSTGAGVGQSIAPAGKVS